MNRMFISEGHLIDSGILAAILNIIVAEGGNYVIHDFKIGKTNLNTSRLEIEVGHETESKLALLTERLISLGCYEKSVPSALLKVSPSDGCVPEDFYSTSNHVTELFMDGRWNLVENQRMDGVIVVSENGPVCKKLRDVQKGDLIVCSSECIRVFPPQRERDRDVFGFMTGEVSSERSVETIVEKVAHELKNIKKNGGRVISVAGPVVIHTGGGGAMSALLREGYLHGLLSGNALAVHDIESQFYGTSLGIEMNSGNATHNGHRNHLRAINKINLNGSIRKTIEQGQLSSGVMYEVIKNNIPYCLAGSIRDDGPLPETETDMIKAQGKYAEILKGADLVLMLSSMLHSIGTGNMLPSSVKTLCVDINPAAVTKLADRGSGQALGIVSDVGLFLRALASRLQCSW